MIACSQNWGFTRSPAQRGRLLYELLRRLTPLARQAAAELERQRLARTGAGTAHPGRTNPLSLEELDAVSERCPVIAARITAAVLPDWESPRRVRELSASRLPGDQDRAEIRAEELAALIKERPGNLFKLITAICFTAAALPAWTRRVIQGLNLDVLVMSPAGVVVLRRATAITTAFATAAVIAMTVDEGLSRSPIALSAGRSYAEVTDNYLGTVVFGDPRGDAVTSGPTSIPFRTHISVKCWAPNESGMGSINAFYLVETASWTGEYAPANTFLNADTTGSLDPHVPMCPAS